MTGSRGPQRRFLQALFGSKRTARSEGASFGQFGGQGNHAGNGGKPSAVVIAQKRRTGHEAPGVGMKRRMEEENWYEYTFEERTKLDKMHYSRVQGGTHKFTMRPLVAMGVGLSLDLSEMEEVLRLGGMAFQDGDREQEAYKYLFTAFYGKGIDECNDFLEAVNVPTLGTQQRK